MRSGDMLLNEATGTTILLLKKIYVDTPTTKLKKTKFKKIIFWETFVSITENSSTSPGIKKHKEKNLREKVERGVLTLLKKGES